MKGVGEATVPTTCLEFFVVDTELGCWVTERSSSEVFEHDVQYATAALFLKLSSGILYVSCVDYEQTYIRPVVHIGRSNQVLRHYQHKIHGL